MVRFFVLSIELTLFVNSMGDTQSYLNSHQTNFLSICRNANACRDSPVCSIDSRNGEHIVEGRLPDAQWLTDCKDVLKIIFDTLLI
jgi:hypothetical protein